MPERKIDLAPVPMALGATVVDGMKGNEPCSWLMLAVETQTGDDYYLLEIGDGRAQSFIDMCQAKLDEANSGIATAARPKLIVPGHGD